MVRFPTLYMFLATCLSEGRAAHCCKGLNEMAVKRNLLQCQHYLSVGTIPQKAYAFSITYPQFWKVGGKDRFLKAADHFCQFSILIAFSYQIQYWPYLFSIVKIQIELTIINTNNKERNNLTANVHR